MRVVIHPSYEYLREFICGIPAREYVCKEIMRESRNRVVRVTADGVPLVVKQYRVPMLINRLAYSFLRMSKARRSYRYAERLLEMGIGSAEPVAWIEEWRGGLFHTGYFIYRYVSGPLLDEVMHRPPAEQEELLEAFARFTVDLHERGVVHWDYNSGNIIFNRPDGAYHFTLIDINRVRFNKRLSKRDCVLGLRNLQWPFPLLVRFVARYAELREWDVELVCGYLLVKKRIHPGWTVRQWLKRAVRWIKGIFTGEKSVPGVRHVG